MSYRCNNCDMVAPTGVRQNKVVVATREHQFPFRAAAHRFVRERKEVVNDDPGGVGRQIVKEVGVCEPCRRLIEGE
jgi:hypothetical protein